MPTALEDKELIRDLLNDYCYLFDTGQAARWAELFTEDCFWDGGTRHVEGREALRELCVKANASGLRFRHITSNVAIAVNGDAARANSYATVYHLAPEGPKLNTVAHYDDHLVRGQDGKWRFRRRAYAKELSAEQLIR
jgi:uncharacterized protein (TIGR02246 family)